MRTAALASALGCVLLFAGCGEKEPAAPKPPPAVKLYWFIPDGLRADPDQFTVFRWAEQGILPNLKKLMDRGARGYSIPDFPSHTPVNFATLLTGARPRTHGVADGPMHTEGAALAAPSLSGFSSLAKRVPPIWSVLEEAGKKVVLMSIPGSTPPQMKQGITVRGRWGGWGADTPAIIFEPSGKLAERRGAGKGFKLFFLGESLTRFVDKRPAAGWEGAPRSASPPFEATLEAFGLPVHGFVYDDPDDRGARYDTVVFSLDKKAVLARVKAGAWSDWQKVTLAWKGERFPSHVKIKVIKLWPNGDFRIRFFYNNVNRLLAVPASIAEELDAGVGPMVDFPDNWPAQLLYEQEDMATFWEEANMALDWHARAASFVLRKYRPDAFIQDTYTPNQMLESRWWLRRTVSGDPGYDPGDAERAWADLHAMYRKVDATLGEAMNAADESTLIVLSSDHGIMPIHKRVQLNNLFARKGWLKFSVDPATGEPTIDWPATKVIYLKMAHVYLHPEGLGGRWKRGSGPAYEALRAEVIQALDDLVDGDESRGKRKRAPTAAPPKPIVRIVKWEDAPGELDMPSDRVGDLVLTALPGYQLWEEVTAPSHIFSVPLSSGYKQAIDPRTTKEVWTPFAIAGPGVKKGVKLDRPIAHIDQLPTILRLMGVDLPGHVEGRVLTEILEQP